MSNAEKTPGENSLEKSTIEQLPHVTSDKPSVKFHQSDDIQPENVWFYCMECDEEYHLPEDWLESS